MSPRFLALAFLTLLAAPAAAQGPNYKHLAAFTAGPDLNWPNWPNPSVPGDCLWKVVPASAMKNAAGAETAVAIEFMARVVNVTAGVPAVQPEIEIRDVIDTGGGCLVPDFNAPARARATLRGGLSVPSSGAYVVSRRFLQSATIANGPFALCVLAPPGESASSASVIPGFRAGTGSHPDPSGCGVGFCGAYDAATGTVIRYAPAVELMAWLGFAEPTIQPQRDFEDRGYGAYDFSVGDGTHTLRYLIQSLQHFSKPAIVLISFQGNSTPLTLDGQTVCLEPGPFLDAILVLNGPGYLGSTGYWTLPFPIPADAVGFELHAAMFVFDLQRESFVGASNTCTTRFLP